MPKVFWHIDGFLLFRQEQLDRVYTTTYTWLKTIVRFLQEQGREWLSDLVGTQPLVEEDLGSFLTCLVRQLCPEPLI